MKNDQLLQELRAQRELIRRHLAWLDRQISEFDEAEPSKEAVARVHKPEIAEVKPEIAVEGVENDRVSSQKEDTEVEDFPNFSRSSSNELERAKTGCLILFLLSTALFLFLLFGLPYLID